MKIIKIEKNNLINGPGMRCVVWVSGCSHNCPGCHNPETHNPNIGEELNQSHIDEIMQQLARPDIAGVTFTGGDPMHPANRSGIMALSALIKTTHPEKNIWCWTGYRYEMIKDDFVMNHIDVLVDGPYIAALNPGIGKIKWRGSSNQRIIDVQKSILKKETVE